MTDPAKKPARKSSIVARTHVVMSEPRFIESMKVKQVGPLFTLAHKGSTYKVVGRDVVERVLYDIYRQQADGREWLAPSGKAIPPYHPQHEPSESFKAALATVLK